MSNFSYIDNNQDNNDTFHQLITNEEKKNKSDSYDKQLQQLNNSMLDWKFNKSRRNLGVGIYGNLTDNTFYQSSRNKKYDTSTLHNTSNDRINAHIFKDDIDLSNNPYHQSNNKRNHFIETENKLRNLPINNHSTMKKNIKKKTFLENHVKPRQNKYSKYPSKQNTYNETLLDENNLRYSQLKKKTEETSNAFYIQSKRNELLTPRQNTVIPSPQNDNSYIERIYPTNSNNPTNRII